MSWNRQVAIGLDLGKIGTLRRWRIAARRITVHHAVGGGFGGAWPEKIWSAEVAISGADETGTLYSETCDAWRRRRRWRRS